MNIRTSNQNKVEKNPETNKQKRTKKKKPYRLEPTLPLGVVLEKLDAIDI